MIKLLEGQIAQAPKLLAFHSAHEYFEKDDVTHRNAKRHTLVYEAEVKEVFTWGCEYEVTRVIAETGRPQTWPANKLRRVAVGDKGSWVHGFISQDAAVLTTDLFTVKRDPR